MTTAEFLEIFFVAAAPISELRGAIPLGISFDISWPAVYFVALAGNILPVPFILLLLGPVSRILSKVKIFERILNFIFKISRKRGGIVEKYGALGLVFFVAIPLPITGAWTGSIVAFLLDIKFKRAFPAIVLGVIIAGIIVTAAAVLLDYAFFTKYTVSE